MRGNETPNPMWTKFCRMVGISNIGTYTNFDDDRLRGFGVVGSIFFSYTGFRRRTLAILCEGSS